MWNTDAAAFLAECRDAFTVASDDEIYGFRTDDTIIQVQDSFDPFSMLNKESCELLLMSDVGLAEGTAGDRDGALVSFKLYEGERTVSIYAFDIFTLQTISALCNGAYILLLLLRERQCLFDLCVF